MTPDEFNKRLLEVVGMPATFEGKPLYYESMILRIEHDDTEALVTIFQDQMQPSTGWTYDVEVKDAPKLMKAVAAMYGMPSSKLTAVTLSMAVNIIPSVNFEYDIADPVTMMLVAAFKEMDMKVGEPQSD